MVVLAIVGNAKPDRHLIKKFDVLRYKVRRFKVVAAEKDHFVTANLELLLRKDRLFSAPIDVGCGFCNLAM